MIDYSLRGSFICEHCRETCSGKCFDELSAIQDGTAKKGSKEYEKGKDLIGRKQIIRCLGKYCPTPCKFQLDDYTPYRAEDGVKPLMDLIEYLGNKVHDLLEERENLYLC